MSRLSMFNSPLLLGFDHFERALDRVSKISTDGYPPYNIEQLGENALQITLAVAGFTMGDLGITIEDNQLVVRGKQAEDTGRVDAMIPAMPSSPCWGGPCPGACGGSLRGYGRHSSMAGLALPARHAIEAALIAK